MFICKQKIQLHPSGETCYFGYFGHVWLWLKYCQLVESFHVYLQAKKQLHHPCFFGDLQNHTNFFFWTLWASLAMHTQNDSIKLKKTLTFIWMPKMNCIVHFFLEIVHLKKSYNLIGQPQSTFWSITQEPEFCQI